MIQHCAASALMVSVSYDHNLRDSSPISFITKKALSYIHGVYILRQFLLNEGFYTSEKGRNYYPLAMSFLYH